MLLPRAFVFPYQKSPLAEVLYLLLHPGPRLRISHLPEPRCHTPTMIDVPSGMFPSADISLRLVPRFHMQINQLRHLTVLGQLPPALLQLLHNLITTGVPSDNYPLADMLMLHSLSSNNRSTHLHRPCLPIALLSHSCPLPDMFLPHVQRFHNPVILPWLHMLSPTPILEFCQTIVVESHIRHPMPLSQ